MSAQPPAAEQAPPPSGGGFTPPMVSLRRHWRKGLIVAVVVAVVGLAVGYKKGAHKTYEVTSMVYVSPRFLDIMGGAKELDLSSYQQFRQFVEHQTQAIKRYDTLDKVLADKSYKPDANNDQTYDVSLYWNKATESQRQAVERLQKSLTVVAIKDSYLISIILQSDSAEGLDIVLRAVVDGFMKTAKEDEFFYKKTERVDKLNINKKEAEDRIAAAEARRTEISRRLGVTTFIATMASAHDQLLLDTETALATTRRERLAAEGALRVFEDENGREKRDALDAAAFDIVAKDATLNTTKGNLLGRRTKLLELFSGLEDAHPLKSKIVHELKELDDEILRVGQDETQRVGNMLLSQRRAEVEKTRRIERELEQQVKLQRQDAAQYASDYNEALTLNDLIARNRKTLDTIQNRMDFLTVESDAPGFLRWESIPLPPEGPIKGGRKKPMMMAVIAAIALGFLVPIGIDMTERRIKTANQVHKLLGFAPLAGMLEPSEEIAVRRLYADQKRRLSIALERQHQLHGTQLFLLTSVKPGAGVTSLAFELAMEFAELGVSALVVEANPFKPDARYTQDRFQTGLLDLLSEAGELDEAILPAVDLLPDRIGIGFPVQPHLFGYKLLRELLTVLKTRYDIVLLDAPPVLLSGDVEFLACMADHTVLLVGARQVLPAEVKRAATVLEKVNPPALSVVVTNLEIYHGGGYFAQKVKEYTASAQHGEIMNAFNNSEETQAMKPVFLYALHSGNLYGTERMALYTLVGLRDAFRPVLFAPPGAVVAEANRLGIETIVFNNARQFAWRLRPWLAAEPRLAFAATGVMHSLAFNALNLLYRRPSVHLQLVHGGTDEKQSYGRKKLLNGTNVHFVAVSEFVRERLLANGVNASQISVVGNFLPDERIAAAPRRAAFIEDGIRRVTVVSRVDPIKRVDLLLDALDGHPELADLPIHVYGLGWDFDRLRERARQHHPNVVFDGFNEDVAGVLTQGDLLLHLCPVEPFGLALLEAMAAGVPVLTPDSGGAGGLVEAGVSGFKFRANDAEDLARALNRLRQIAADDLNRVVAAADERLKTRYSSSACLESYRNLFKESLHV